MKRKIFFGAVFLSLLLFLGVWVSRAGAKEMHDGFYTAEMADYSHGWKEYLCILVKKDRKSVV